MKGDFQLEYNKNGPEQRCTRKEDHYFFLPKKENIIQITNFGF